MQDQIFELQYAMDTFYFLICGALVMWMAAGFAILEIGRAPRLNSSHTVISYAVFCLKKKNN